MTLTPEEITDSIYKAYGTDSGILFGIKERDIVKAIVEFTVNRLDIDAQLKQEREMAGKMREALENMIYQYGYRTVINGSPAIGTGGMSALEHAFKEYMSNSQSHISSSFISKL